MGKEKRIKTGKQDRYYIYNEETKTLEEKKYGFFSDSTVERLKIESLTDALAYIQSKAEEIRSIEDKK